MQKALEFAIKSTTIKRQTESQIREKLEKRFPDEDAEAIIGRLIELNYLNDVEFSEAWVSHRSMSSPKGKFALRQELRRKGIDEKDMQGALDNFNESDVLGELAQHRWSGIKEANPWKKKEKLQRFLISRGFQLSEVFEVVNKVANNPEEC